jgi:hypothetical protein
MKEISCKIGEVNIPARTSDSNRNRFIPVLTKFVDVAETTDWTPHGYCNVPGVFSRDFSFTTTAFYEWTAFFFK